MALLPQDRQSQVMMLITLGMLALGYAFWNYWAKPTGEEIAATQAEIKSMEDVIAQAKADLASRSEEHTSELQSRQYLVCRLLLEKKKLCTWTGRPSSKPSTMGSSVLR